MCHIRYWICALWLVLSGFVLLVFRVFGNRFAEMPFVATKEGYRREGNCKRLLKVSSTFLVTRGAAYTLRS